MGFMNAGQHADARQYGFLKSLISIVATVLCMLVVFWAYTNFVMVGYYIPSGSMESTIEIGDMIFSEKVSYYFRDPEAGDIVTFEDPQVSGRILVKRVIAVEGQTVDLIDGQVVVDGVALDESYANGPSYELSDSVITYPYTVPEGYIWVMGDNRTNSQDSRYFGAVSVKSVTGRAFFVYWQKWDDLPSIWESNFWEKFWEEFHLGPLS